MERKTKFDELFEELRSKITDIQLLILLDELKKEKEAEHERYAWSWITDVD